LSDDALAEAWEGVFAFEEPYYRAGVFVDVVVYAWRDLLDRTM
jgi:hypothetical protein